MRKIRSNEIDINDFSGKTIKEKQIHIRVTDSEKEEIQKNAEKHGFKQISEYLRFLGLTYNIKGK